MFDLLPYYPHMGCFRKWCNPQNTPKWSFLVGKPMVVGYHHFGKPPCMTICQCNLIWSHHHIVAFAADLSTIATLVACGGEWQRPGRMHCRASQYGWWCVAWFASNMYFEFVERYWFVCRGVRKLDRSIWHNCIVDWFIGWLFWCIRLDWCMP